MVSVHEEMQTIVERILEDWALMLVEPGSAWQEMFNPAEPYLVGMLQFKGVVSGTYSVICQAGFAKALSCNLLGFEEAVDACQMQDAVCEMVNVLSGNLLTSSYGEEVVFELTSPKIVIMNHEEVATYLKAYTLCYQADDHPVVVAFLPERVDHGN